MFAPKISKYVYWIKKLVTLSSARSLGKNMVGLMFLIFEICTKLMAVLPELA